MNLNLKRIKDRDKEGLILYEVPSMSHLILIKSLLLTFERAWIGAHFFFQFQYWLQSFSTKTLIR